MLQRRALGVGGVGDERREHVTGADLGDAVERHEGERVHRYATAASVSRASAAATRASIIKRLRDLRAHPERADLVGA